MTTPGDELKHRQAADVRARGGAVARGAGPGELRRGRSMTRAAAAAMSALVVLGSGRAAGQEAAAPGRADEVRDAERRLAQAMHARDRTAIERLLAPDYVLRSAPDVDRETWIRNAMTLCWGDRSDIDDFRARSHGDVVLASFELTFYVDPASCRPAVLRSLITDVWSRDAGGWRLRLRHSGPPPAADAGIAAQYGAVPQPPPVWDANGELSFVATSGNTSTRTLGAGGTILHRAGAGITRASLAFVSSEADDVTRAESVTVQARHGFRARDRLEVFGRGAYARDRFAGIGDRVAGDVGAGYTVSWPRHALTTEGSLGFTVEERLDATELRFVTLTGAVNYVWTLRPDAELIEQVGVASDVETWGNWRGTSTTSIAVSLTRLLSLRMSHAVEYRNRPVAGFGRADMRTAAAVVLSWQRPAAP